MWRIGVDSGGTFTDICLLNDATGERVVWKTPSTPDDPSLGIVRGIEEVLAAAGAKSRDVGYFGHGTTVGTNTLIQRSGASAGLVTTKGFRDLLEIGRQKRPDLYDLQADKPLPLITRDLRHEIAERVGHDGSVLQALDVDALRAAIRELREAGVQSVAICFLYSFSRPAHEDTAARVLAEEFPEAFPSVSFKVAPEFREFERLSTTVVNAHLGPVIKVYIDQLRERLRQAGILCSPHITQSNGGVIGFETAAEFPVRTLLSGPSTGVVAAQAIGSLTGVTNLITFDMGGTSTDVALLQDGKAGATNEAVVNGYPIIAPMLDIHAVGAGGGSIAYVDGGGLLKVGPRSAGADPGPVCYGRGNLEPTVTDANVVLKTSSPRHLLGGRMEVRRELALAAITALGERLGFDVFATANGILRVVTANMAKAIRVVSTQKGHDPRDYTLLAFGGAGPLHAARLAEDLEIEHILVPRNPGILCAEGLLVTDLRMSFVESKLRKLAGAVAADLLDAHKRLCAEAERWFEHENIAPEARRTIPSVDMRYAGQNYELKIPFDFSDLGRGALDSLERGFAAAHERLFGFVSENDPMQITSLRLEAIGLVKQQPEPPRPAAGSDASHAVVGERDVWLAECDGFTPCKIYARDRLLVGNILRGPAIVDQMDATTLVLPSMIARVDPYLNLGLERGS